MYELLDQVPTPLVVIALEPPGGVVFVNARFTETFGFTREDLAAASPPSERLIASDDQRARARTWWGALARAERGAGSELPVEELELVTRDGEVRYTLVQANKSASTVILSLVDITDRKRAEAQLRVSEERHRLLAENARDVVWTMSPEGRITYVSPLVEKVRGFTPEEAMAQPIEDIHPPASAARSTGYFLQLFGDLQAGRPPQRFRGELEYKCKDGSTFWTEVMALPVMGSDGKLKEVLGVTRDLSERKAAEDALKAALAKNEALVEELRTALQEVKTLSGLLPICMFCKKIRNNEGYWDQLESYISSHTGALFSHGMCDSCAAEHFGM